MIKYVLEMETANVEIVVAIQDGQVLIVVATMTYLVVLALIIPIYVLGMVNVHVINVIVTLIQMELYLLVNIAKNILEN